MSFFSVSLKLVNCFRCDEYRRKTIPVTGYINQKKTAVFVSPNRKLVLAAPNSSFAKTFEKDTNQHLKR